MTILILPWPDKKLNPNNRSHWRVKAPIKAAQKEVGYNVAIENIPLKQDTYHLELIFHPPTKAHRDIDNLLSSVKSMLDGVALAWGVNDKNFRPITIDFGDIVKKEGKVVLRVLE